MKTLYESILDSDEQIMETSKYSIIRNLILNAKTKRDITKLQKRWDDAGLGIKDAHWEIGWRQEIDYVMGTMILINSYNRNGWDIEITREDFNENIDKVIIKKLVKKLEDSGHFVIDKHPTGSEHWLAKIV